MDEIRNALINAGKEVITHTDAVSVPGWSGAGYIITDSVTGEGAYKIAGGGNGSFIAGVLFANSLLLILSLFVSLPVFAVITAVYLAAAAIFLAALSAAIGVVYLIHLEARGGVDLHCFITGMLLGLHVGASKFEWGYAFSILGIETATSTFPNPKECF